MPKILVIPVNSSETAHISIYPATFTVAPQLLPRAVRVPKTPAHP